MPPFLPRRDRQISPQVPQRTPKKKPSLFETADESTPARSIDQTQQLVNSLDVSDSSSSLSEVNSSEFEDTLPNKKLKTKHDSEEEDVEWEDALQPIPMAPVAPSTATGDLELTLTNSMNVGSLTELITKKGPSKRDRQVRSATHCIHVQFLMWHNWIRSVWANDKEVQKILLDKLNPVQMKAVEDWRRRSGLSPLTSEVSNPNVINKRKRVSRKASEVNARNQRDWGNPAVRIEAGRPDMSNGDPIIKLLETLSAWWKRTFRISAPGLRKIGYKSLGELQEDIESFRKDSHNPEDHGERIEGIQGFRACARKLEGSRDIGAQLFTALLRGLGIEARLVASLQPIGFGWNKAEEAHPKRTKSQRSGVIDIESTDITTSEDEGGFLPEVKAKKSIFQNKTLASKLHRSLRQVSTRQKPHHGVRNAPIELSDESGSFGNVSEISESEESVIEVTPEIESRKPNARYDRDMKVPNYWSEVVSHISQQVIPVDAVVNQKIVLKDEEKPFFEPKGKKTEKTKQVFAYVIAFSSDGTAKDVTVRYLKRHSLPGKTKGVRMSAEKIPVYNKKGQVKRYEEYDWFKTIISGYMKPDHLRLPIDDVEDTTDLRPAKQEKRSSSQATETLQGYKQSAEFVLERHLRREEALLPKAKPVKTFIHGKGEKALEEPVYLRKDVVGCKTAESWHKEGRQIKTGVQPLKKVPVRAVTLTRKLEIEQTERETGEKATQGMYSKAQTEYIIPPPIIDGVIPKNSYGNIDCFVESMVPRGAVHLPYRGTVRVCKKLGIDYAEAVVGFDFGNKRAVPVIQGVVIAEENEGLVIELFQKEEEEKRIKEEGRREKLALGTWKKFLMGLRIIERVREEYGVQVDEERDEINPFTNRKTLHNTSSADGGFVELYTGEDSGKEELEGGFVVENGEE